MATSLVLSHKERIIINGSLATKSNDIWKKLSICLKNKIKPESLYSAVVNNRHNILDQLKKGANSSRLSRSDLSGQFESSIDMDDSHNSVYNKKTANFEILISPHDFDRMTEIVEYNQNTREGSKLKRKYKKFKKGAWEGYFNKEIWNNTQIR